MATKRTYSVRLKDTQREQLEERAVQLGLPTGHLIRTAIDDFLRQEEEKDYLNDVRATIMTAITRLARQVEKDRAEQQLIVGFLDHFHDWLAFAIPSPADREVAEQLRLDRRESFYRELPSKFASQSRASLTKSLDDKDAGPIYCPACGTGHLRSKTAKSGRQFWYCSNWNVTSNQCSAKFADEFGSPARSGNSID